jgi:hypothetical protein
MMKRTLLALVIAVLIMPQFGYAESPDNKGADEEYMLLLRFELETTPASLSAEAEKDKASEEEQKKKIIITIIPDSSCALPLDCP